MKAKGLSRLHSCRTPRRLTITVVIIVVVLGSMFASLGATTSRANQRIDTFRDARAALQTMSRDLANLVHVQPAAYFTIDTDLGGADVRQIDGLISLKNQPPGSPAPIRSDVCAVRYYCSWNNNAYSLHRYFRDSSQTFQTLQSNLSVTGSLNYMGNLGSIYGGSGTDDVRRPTFGISKSLHTIRQTSYRQAK